jgi:hypothetical protein
MSFLVSIEIRVVRKRGRDAVEKEESRERTVENLKVGTK